MDRIAWNDILGGQIGAAIDTLDNAIAACPEHLWQARLYVESDGSPDFAAFWYIAYHCIFWLDFYLSENAENFAPPPPYTLSEFDPAGVIPDRVYTQAELRAYLAYARNKCRTRLESLSLDELTALTHIRADWLNMSVAGLFLYTMRHLQEHAAQLSLFLGQQVGDAPGWVSGVRRKQS